jgi:hypothetical protein
VLLCLSASQGGSQGSPRIPGISELPGHSRNFAVAGGLLEAAKERVKKRVEPSISLAKGKRKINSSRSREEG